MTDQWWRDAVVYQIYPRSFADGNGDGMGDLPGITGRLEALTELGVDAVWLSPFYVSPQADAGYDVADYRDVDPRFGTLTDFDALTTHAHALGLKVIVDLVPNHSSDEHVWFQQALAAGAGTPERGRYVFRDGKGDNGNEPPNNWQSLFGGAAWERTTDPDGAPGQWYLHLFDVKQPDFDWTNDEVREMFHDVLRFWLDRGVDGFRVDVAHALIKADGLPDVPEISAADPAPFEQEIESEAGDRGPMWDQDGVHEIYRDWNKILGEYSGMRMMVAEAWVSPPSRLARYVRADEMQQSFNFDFLTARWSGPDLRAVIESSLRAVESVGAPATWVLSNHDVIRHASRLALPGDEARPGGIGADDPQPDVELGLRRARAATALMLALPGSAYVYQGEELGLPEHTTLPDAAREDPTWKRSGHTERGRDGCRVPIPWEADAPSLGFGTTSSSWLPQPADYRALARDQQSGDPSSTLEFYRRALRLRRELQLGKGRISWQATDPAILAIDNERPASSPCW
ncbi:MAG: glycoside hydrolase family 13 protein [Nakamurella sp.]